MLKENRWSQRKWEEAWDIARTDKVIANRNRGIALSGHLPLVKEYTSYNYLCMTFDEHMGYYCSCNVEHFIKSPLFYLAFIAPS